VYLRFCRPSTLPSLCWPLVHSSLVPFFLSLSLSLSLLSSSEVLHFSFDLTRPDRPVHVCSRNNYIPG
jgi:hypothetical protein